MDDLFLEKNISIIHRRWPDLIPLLEAADPQTVSLQQEQNTLIANGIQLTSNYDREAEAQLQAGRIPLDSNRAFVYGCGMGDLQNCLLQRETLKEIHVCIMNFALFLHVLNYFDQSSWLKDERIRLVSYLSTKEVLYPFVVLPSELILAEDSAAQLRDRLFLELNHDFLSQKHSKHNPEVLEEINKNIELIASDPDISDLFEICEKTIFIAASGPTLEDHFDWLKKSKDENKQPFIIALDASLKPLMSIGIIPGIVVSIDSKADFLFDGIDYHLLKNTRLVYFPRLAPSFLKSWPGPRYCSYSTGELYDDINKNFPKQRLYSAGSVIHPAVDLAVKMNPTKIILLGADFSFVYNKSNAHWEQYDDYITDDESEKVNINNQHWLMNSLGQKVQTMANLKGYLRDLETYISQQPQISFFNGSELGAKIEGTELWNP